MRRIILLAVVLLAGCTPEQKDPTTHRIDDPKSGRRVDYLILTADRFADGLGELVAHREKGGYAVGVVTVSSVREKFASIRAFLAHAIARWEPPAPSYLLIVGDADAVPPVVRDAEFGGGDLATDFGYACPVDELKPLLHVGRFPCDTPEELAAMIRKTIDYETKLAAGAWQRRIALMTGVAGFSKEIDAVIERLFQKVIAGGIPAAYDIEVAYANPRSPYCPYPPKFNDNALRMLNDGALFYAFVGHGEGDGVDVVRWRNETYPILDRTHAERIDVREGLPLMVIIACTTGRFDNNAPDCVGEVFFKRPRGPVAFLGGSRVTQPYGNALIGKALVDQVFGETATFGEALTRAKEQVLRHEKSPITLQSDYFAATAQGKETLAPMRRDCVRHYNLLGDPALVLRRPAEKIKLSLTGKVLRIEADVEEVELKLECARDKFAHPIEKKLKSSDKQFRGKISARYTNANNKVIRSWRVRLAAGAAE
ncbi:MAG: C25 family cysteine peptidase, partial [Planctomycetota bacterium]